MRTAVSELPDSRVRVEVDVEAPELDRRLERSARELAREMKLPGFRKGKVPPAMVIQRLGREAVLEQALRDSLPEWYERALLEASISPVGDPKLDVPAMPQEGEPLSFSIEVAVRPRAKLGDYRGLEVGRAEPDVPEEAIEAELERLREGFASLRPVEREAREGDFVLVDYSGSSNGEPIEGAEARDFLLELGSGSVLDGFDEALAGASAGERRTAQVTFPDDYRPERLAGTEASFEVEVKEVREKQLPELDEEFAAQASEFDTLDELREDVAAKLRVVAESRSAAQFRDAALDAAVAEAEVAVPDEVAHARAEETVERFLHRLSHQGVDPDSFARIQEGGREGMVASVKPEAEQQLKRESVLTAIAEAESIEVSDAELADSLRPAAEQEGVKVEKLFEQLRSSGRDALLREDLRLRKAAELVADSAQPIPLEQAAAREKLWTPEKERDEKGSLWTPGSGE